LPFVTEIANFFFTAFLLFLVGMSVLFWYNCWLMIGADPNENTRGIHCPIVMIMFATRDPRGTLKELGKKQKKECVFYFIYFRLQT